MTVLFVSDLHLAPERPAVVTAFFAFLRECAGTVESLYILGDLFEAWIGDDDPSPLARQVVSALRGLTAAGTKVFFQTGNRDFAVGRRFARETGCVLLGDWHLVEMSSEPVLVMHGDTLCTDDVAYQNFRRRVRNPVLLAAMRHLPLFVRRRMAIRGRARSAATNRYKAEDIMDVAPQAVVEVMLRHGVRTLIHGHTHRPGVYPLTVDGKSARRIVLGDWGDRGWILNAGGSDLELVSFPIPNDSGSGPLTRCTSATSAARLEPVQDLAQGMQRTENWPKKRSIQGAYEHF